MINLKKTFQRKWVSGAGRLRKGWARGRGSQKAFQAHELASAVRHAQMPSRWYTPFDTLGWLEGVHLCARVLCRWQSVGRARGRQYGREKGKKGVGGSDKKV